MVAPISGPAITVFPPKSGRKSGQTLPFDAIPPSKNKGEPRFASIPPLGHLECGRQVMYFFSASEQCPDIAACQAPRGRRPRCGHAGSWPSIIQSLILMLSLFCSISASPMPSTRPRSWGLLKGPFYLRSLTMASALAGPTPVSSLASAASSAELIFTGPAKALPAARPRTTAAKVILSFLTALRLYSRVASRRQLDHIAGISR